MKNIPDHKTVRISRRRIKEKLYRRRYLLPNLVTIGNMFCGYLTAIYAASGRFEKASLAIGLAILLDGLDGRVARRLNATSKFGVEFDSFSDLVSFGIAPAVLMYHWCFKATADEFGVAVSFVYVICAASRLARFNIMPPSLKSFVGLPSPGAAGVVAALVNFAPHINPSTWLTAAGAVTLLAIAALMVSRIEFFSVKQLRVHRLGFAARAIVGALIALLWYDHQIGLLVVTVGYAASGPLQLVNKKRRVAAALRTHAVTQPVIPEIPERSQPEKLN